MFSTRNLQRWVVNGHAEQRFKWVEWVALTSTLFVAATYCKGWSSILVLAIATASMVQCYMVSVAWLIGPLLARLSKLSRNKVSPLLLSGLVFIGSSAALGCTIAAIASLILSALAQDAA